MAWTKSLRFDDPFRCERCTALGSEAVLSPHVPLSTRPESGFDVSANLGISSWENFN